jgi:hypothetical protein
MRKALGILAVLGLVAAPVMADLMPSDLTPQYKSLNPIPGGHGSVFPGYYTAGSSFVYVYGANSEIYAEPSDLITVTFAFHWPYATGVTGIQFQSSLVYDNNEVAVVSTAPPVKGPFAGKVNNYPPPTTTGTHFAWSQGNPSAGTWTVGDVLGTGVPLFIGHPSTGSVAISGSGIYPFMQVVLHVKDDVRVDGMADIVIGSAALLFWFPGGPTTYWTSGGGMTPSWGEDIIPEPASLSLLGVGVVAIGAGVWRRRRR